MKHRLNCWIVAMWLWLYSKGYVWASVRRSHWYRGFIPHFSIFRNPGRFCLHVEYIPDRRKGSSKTMNTLIPLFRGIYKVTLYKKISTSTSVDYYLAIANTYKLAGKTVEFKSSRIDF